MNTEVSVNVASLLQPFVLKEVSIGLNGDRPDMQSWLEEMDTSAPYSEEAFEWKIARLLPCPRSFFTLLYENESKDGNLRIIFGARKESMEASDSYEKGTEGYCNLCYARVTHQYERILHEGEYGTVDTGEDSSYTWSGKTEFCMICYDSEAYISFMRDVRPQNISTFKAEYLDRLEELYDHIEEYRNRV